MTHANFMDLVLRRNLVLLFRSELVQVLHDPKPILATSRRIPQQDIDQVCQNNQLSFSQFNLMHQYYLADSGQPIWWRQYRLTTAAVVFVIACGIPVNFEAHSEDLMPWFAIFSSVDVGAHETSLFRFLASLRRVYATIEQQRNVWDALFHVRAAHRRDKFNPPNQDFPRAFNSRTRQDTCMRFE